MFNNTTELMFLKKGDDLKALIHQSLEECFQVIFKHHGQSNLLTPAEITSKKNYVFSLYKFFHNHKQSDFLFDEEWCNFVFKLSRESSDQYKLLKQAKNYICASMLKKPISKTQYKTIKSSLRLFFYIMWRNKGLLLPFDYKPPKSRSPSNKEWVDLGLEMMPETLQLILNTFVKKSHIGNLEAHYKASLNTLKSYGYKCIITSTWYTIEDIDIDEVIEFKEFYASLRVHNLHYATISATLPFNDLLKSFYSYAPERCDYQLTDLERLALNLDEPKTTSLLNKKEFSFKANLTDAPLLLMRGDALRLAISNAYSNTKITLLNRIHQGDGSFEPEKLKDYASPNTTFIRVFRHGIPANLETIFHLYELLSYDYVSKFDLKDFLGDEEQLSDWDELRSDNFKSGIRIFFVELYNVEAVLLPLTFDIATRKALATTSVRFPEVLRLIWDFDALPPEIVNRVRSPKFLHKAVLSCNWRRVQDITCEDALEYQILYQARSISSRSNVSLPLFELLEAFLTVAPERCQYSLEDLSEIISDTNVATLIKKTSVQKADKDLGFRWKYLINQYLEERRNKGYSSENRYITALGKLLQYVSVDLPREFGKSSDLIPKTPNEFKRFHFIGNNLITHSLKHKLKMTLSNNGFNINLRAISTFFDWLIDTHHEVADISGFRNPIVELDYVNAPRRDKTDKQAFLGSQFSYIHSFFSSVCEFYWYLVTNNHFVEGASNRRLVYDTQEVGYVPLVSIDGTFYPLYLVPASLTTETLMGKESNIKSYPQFQTLFENLVALETGLRHIHIRWLDRDNFDVNGHHSQRNYIGELLVNYALTNESDSIEVGSDKVKTIPWQPYVSSRVLNLLRRLKAFQDRIEVEVPSLWYNDHEGSPHGKIRSLFNTLDATKFEPNVISDSSVAKQYRRMLFFFDLFIQLSEIPDVDLLGETPQQSLDVIESAREQVNQRVFDAVASANPEGKPTDMLLAEFDAYKDENKHQNYSDIWQAALKGAFYFNGKYETPFTPHGTRSSVASDRIKVLPPEAIKEFITGHESTAVLSYYIQIDPEYLQEIGDFNQLLMLSGAYSKNVGSKSLSESNRAALQAKLKEIIERDPSLLVRDYGAMSFTTESKGETIKGGIPLLNITPVSNLAIMPTHICPFGGKCPDDIKQDVGEMQCGQCYYSIKTVDNIPRILAHIRKLFDEMVEKRDSIREAKEEGADKAALQVMEAEVVMISRELAAWIYTYQILEDNLQALRAREANSPNEFFVAKPDMLMQHYAEGKIENNEVTQLLVRIQDAQSFKEYFTPQLKGKISKIRKKILINEKHFEKLLDEPTGYDLLDEFRGILRAFTETRGITLEEATRQLSQPLHVRPRANLLEAVNA
ncbi:hypothetical protein [Alteromonas lipotrueiana]|uniref:hypothetical protein n=1 Tax=Alteromonas lipotrueiana TaxID=2803815 RepID=UPI001C489AEA|nr:hypothetical protein [Alteromonas lipotrueiana]